MKISILFFCAALIQAQELASRLDDAVKTLAENNKKFMGSVLVAKHDEVVLSRGYGFANLEWDIPNTPDTKFRLGSISKQFTAACILRLEEQGKLSVSDPVKKYLDDAPPTWDKITIHHVLTHTAGIPSVTDFPDFPVIQRQPATQEKLYRLVRDKPLEFEPGTKFKYSNSGYLLLTYLIERITHGKYEDFLQQNVLTPAALKDTGYDVNARILRHRASGYAPFGTITLNAAYVDMSVPGGAGALYSTTEDLLHWEQSLFGGKVLKPESLRKMTTPALNQYAYGLFVREVNGHKRIGHTGGIEGFNTQLTYLPDDKVVVAVLGNINGPTTMRIADRLVTLASESK